MRRIPATVLAAVFLWFVALSQPAAGHSAGGMDGSNFKTRLTSVTPQVDGVEVRVVEDGNRLQVTNRTDTDVVVLGYRGEPYLRVGPDGVFENRRSPTTHLNQDRHAMTAVPGSADPEADPDWQKISDDRVARWHDHRAHWMSEENPPSVRSAPGQRHTVIPQWLIPLQHGNMTIEVRGDLLWIPGPSPWPWVALAVVLFAGTLGASRLRSWYVLLPVLLAVLVVLDVVHAAGAAAAIAGDLASKVGGAIAGSYLSIVGWVAGIVGVVLLARRSDDGFYAAAFGGVFVALSGGLVDVADLSRSQLPFVWPDAIARLSTATSLGIGFGMLVAAVLHLRPAFKAAVDEPDAAATPPAS